jgi:hypothetical protein
VQINVASIQPESGEIMKNKMIFLVMLLAGCATQSGVMPEGQDAYLIILSGGYGFTSSIDLKIKAHKEAGAFCMSLDERPETIYEKSILAGIDSDSPGEELKFRCIASAVAQEAPQKSAPVTAPVQ